MMHELHGLDLVELGVDVPPRAHHDHGPATAGTSPWALDNVELVTVGVDVGSSTSHLVFSRLHLQRLTQSLSSRFAVVARDELHRSPILLTPFTADGLIDVEELERFVAHSYENAGVEPAQVDTGVVILTGVALERANARAVAELFAGGGGRFVCASAGHNLEAILAAHGSGAVAFGRRSKQPVLHLDIGGGTTKLALVVGGEILQTAAIAVGGRLVAVDEEGTVVRSEAAAAEAAELVGLDVKVGARLRAGDRERLAGALADALVEAIFEPGASGLAQALMLTDPLAGPPGPGTVFTCSGGVSEYLFGRQAGDFGDLAGALARQLTLRLEHRGASLTPTGEGIRATAIGASQYTVQLSGNTVLVSDTSTLPLRNLPVVRARLGDDLDPAGVADAVRAAMARLDLHPDVVPCVALPWSGEPYYRSLRALASGVADACAEQVARHQPLILALEADVGRGVGAILREELGVSAPVVSLDGLDLQELDYVDIGTPLQPSGVVPVVVKSLAFAAVEA